MTAFRRTVLALAMVATGALAAVGSADARVESDEPVVAVPGFSQFQLPDIAYNPDRDEYLIVYRASTPIEVRAVRLAGDGTPLGAPTTVAVDDLSSAFSGATPDVVYNPGSKQYLVYFERTGLDSPPGSGRSGVLRGILLTDTGAIAQAEVDLNPREGDFFFCDAADPHIAAHPDGRYILTHLRRYATTSTGGSCVGLEASSSQVLVRSLSSSLAAGPTTVLSAPKLTTNLELPQVAVADDGNVLVTWRDSEFAVVAARLSSTLALDGSTPLDYEATAPGTQIRNPVPAYDAVLGNWIVFSTTPFGAAASHVLSSDGAIVREGVITSAFRLADVAGLGNGTYGIANTSNKIWHLDGRTGELLDEVAPLRAPLAVVTALASTGDPADPRLTVVGLHPDSVDLSTVQLSMFPPGSLPLVPARILETREGDGLETVDGTAEGIGTRQAGSTYELQVGGRAGVPEDASAAQLNIAAAGAVAAGFVTGFPCDADRPTTSNLNFGAGAASSAGAFVKLSPTGTVCLFVSTDIELIVDVNGYVPGTGSVVSLVPARLLETRPDQPDGTTDGDFNGDGRVAAGSTTELVVTGRGGVPDDAETVIVNITAVRPSEPVFVTAYPCGEDRPTAANLNAAAGSFVNNLVVAKVGTDGTVCLFSSGSTDLIVDLNAFVPAGGGLISSSPQRYFESRAGESTFDGEQQPGALVAAESTTEVPIGGRGVVPDDAVGVMLNVAAIRPDADGFLTLFPCDADRPNAANVNFAAGAIVSNAVFVKLSGTGEVCVFTSTGTHVTVDVIGYTLDA